ncbi:hypothetical protein MA16_Dca008547 [Dendrobium catenatum]|uniref:Uncharacterized protein n=1 Tax=Dendrobium catenatum TaxID=906689 RepID=A0A2I0XHR2_9ASPA|nr:hypothetical protein MA16_Dca008547 [Dendrobium catenatum]
MGTWCDAYGETGILISTRSWENECVFLQQNTAFTVQLGHGASIQLVNVVITTGNTRATIQFGSFDFPSVVVGAAVPMTGMNTKRPARKLHPVRPPTHRTHHPA